MTMDEDRQTSPQSFVKAAELFGVLAAPIRLQIIGELCRSERNVSHLLEAIDISQPSMSRHLGLLYQAGVVAKRRNGAQMYYRIANESVVAICKLVCADYTHAT